MVKRWVITHKVNGERMYASARQGINTFATKEEAQKRIDAIMTNNSMDTIKSLWTLPLEPWPASCFERHFDPGMMYFDEECGTLFDRILMDKIPYDNHCSDLYIPVNEKTKKLMENYEFKENVHTFTSNIDGGSWYDIPFAYAPYWEKKRGRVL
jgi:hypothetical protein